MGTRGHLGGLAEATLQAALAPRRGRQGSPLPRDRWAGQSEVEIISIADTVLLVLMPGSGDSIQALKAGIMEIPDVIAVNKRDHPAAQDDGERGALDPRPRHRSDWQPPIVLTEAVKGEGIDELWDADRGAPGATLRRRAARRTAGANMAGEVFAVASARAKAISSRRSRDDPELRRLLDAVQRRELDPLTAVREILEKVFRISDRWLPRPGPDASPTSKPRAGGSAASHALRRSTRPRRSRA